MVINRVADLQCKQCQKPLRLWEYKGLEGAWYGSCCSPISDDGLHDTNEIEAVARPPVEGDERELMEANLKASK